MARVLPIAAPKAVPTLDALADRPELAAELPAGTVQALLHRCVAVQTTLLGALAAASARQTNLVEPAEPDRLVDVTEAAKRLATTPDWLYRHSRHLPFVVRNGRQLRFSSDALSRYIRERKGTG